MRVAAFLVIGSVLGAVTSPTAGAPIAPACRTGRFLVPEGGAFLAGPAAPEMEAVVLDELLASTASGCPPRRARLRQRRTGIRVTVRWPQCASLPLNARLRGFMSPDCSTMTGRFAVRRLHLSRDFVASRSRCGDGFLDVENGEQCDQNDPCATGAACTIDCACGAVTSTSTSSTTSSTTSTTTSTTTTSSTSITTTSTTTSSTTTTAPKHCQGDMSITCTVDTDCDRPGLCVGGGICALRCPVSDCVDCRADGYDFACYDSDTPFQMNADCSPQPPMFHACTWSAGPCVP